MLKRTAPRRWGPWQATDKFAPTYQTKKPLFAKTGPVHLYSSKDQAFQGFGDERYYGLIRFREYIRRIWSEKGARFYITSMLGGISIGGSILYQQQKKVHMTSGLIGPKKKFFRSRLTVVFDVDETIVSYGDKAFRLRAGMVPRPYLAELLDYLASIDAEVILWAASSDRYMKQVVQAIDPQGVRISQYIVRDKSWFSEDNWYEKNIRWLKRNVDDTLIIENRPLSVRSCNANAVLVPDFIRGEYMDTGQDYPPNDDALRDLKKIVEDLEKSGRPVSHYLADKKTRSKAIKEIPCHLAMRQLPNELATGNFYFVGDKFAAAAPGSR